MKEAATVPDPSAASFFSAYSCATQSELVTQVAVLFPEAPAAACTPSAKPAVTFVPPVDETVHSRTRPLAAALGDGHPVRNAVGGLEHLVRRRCRDGETGRVACGRGAAAVHRSDGTSALVEADERVDALVVTIPPEASALPPAHENVIVAGSVPSTRCQKTACSIGAAASCAVVPIWLHPAGAVIAPVERDGQLRNHHVAGDGRRGLRDRRGSTSRSTWPPCSSSCRPGRRGERRRRSPRSGRSGTAAAAFGRRAAGRALQPEPCRSSDQRRPAGVTSRPCAVEDRDREDAEADGTTGALEADTAVRVETWVAVGRVELPAPGARPLRARDGEELLGPVDPEEDRLAPEARVARDAAAVSLPPAAPRVARRERDRCGADVYVEAAGGRPRASRPSQAVARARRQGWESRAHGRRRSAVPGSASTAGERRKCRRSPRSGQERRRDR